MILNLALPTVPATRKNTKSATGARMKLRSGTVAFFFERVITSPDTSAVPDDESGLSDIEDP